MSWDTTTEGLSNAFSTFGEIEHCAVLTDRNTGKSRGVGIVKFTTPEAAKAALEQMNGTVDANRPSYG